MQFHKLRPPCGRILPSRRVASGVVYREVCTDRTNERKSSSEFPHIDVQSMCCWRSVLRGRIRAKCRTTYAQTEPRDLDAIAERCGHDVAGNVAKLGLHDSFLWDVIEREIIADSPRLLKRHVG